MPRATRRPAVAPIVVTSYDRELRADVRRVVGYRAGCPCGRRFDRRATWALARLDLLEHRKHTGH